jgi:hypothetical protein
MTKAKDVEIIEVRKYVVVPAQNGWIINMHDHRSGHDLQVICGDAKQLGQFFSKLDLGRKKAVEALRKEKK